MFRQGVGALIAGGVFSLLLLCAAVSDLRSRRIPNRVVAAVAVVGIMFSMIAMRPVHGAEFAAGGLFVGLLIWLPFHALGWIGAGDVKLAAGCGAWLGVNGILHASAAAAIVGGALALVMLLYQRTLRGTAADLVLLFNTIRYQPRSVNIRARPVAEQAHLMPYGVALVIGALAVAWTNV